MSSRPFFTQRERMALFNAMRAGCAAILSCATIVLLGVIVTYSAEDPNMLNATTRPAQNLLGEDGAQLSADLVGWLGLGAYAVIGILLAWALLIARGQIPQPLWARIAAGPAAILVLAAFASGQGGEISPGVGLGGYLGDAMFRGLAELTWFDSPRSRMIAATVLLTPLTAWLMIFAMGGRLSQVWAVIRRIGFEMARAAQLLHASTTRERGEEPLTDVFYSEPSWSPPPAPGPMRRAPASPPPERIDPDVETARMGRPPADTHGEAPIELREGYSPNLPPEPKFEDPSFFEPVSRPGDIEPLHPDPEDALFEPIEVASEPLAVDDADSHSSGTPPFLAPRREDRMRDAGTAEPQFTIGRYAPDYAPPALEMLEDDSQTEPNEDVERRLFQQAERLQRIINEFGVRGDVIDVNPGPVVTQFELEPGPGVKVSRVVALQDDIALSMSAVSCRVAAIPGKNVIGVELPNAERETIPLRRLLEAPKFITDDGALPIALGTTLTGAPVTVDLARAPHMLIAGATGAGKSVAVNAILLSLLYRLNPSELRLLLIDPKKLELSSYNGAPHLLSPVITEAGKALGSLKWAIREMERRYELMSKIGVRDVEGYNNRAERLRRSGGVFEVETEIGVDPETGAPVTEPTRLAPEPMPRIVVVIDEMAELMMVAGKEIEHCVLRLAQMGRASGIHLIAATQRPSVDVITGLIKANFPTRISFQTVSATDSKTILDRPGAERLLGKGDMLYSPGGARLERLHGAFVSDEEVIAATDHLRRQGPAEDEINFDSEGRDGDLIGDSDGVDGDDALYNRARAIVLAEKRASASFLQRRLQVGYNRASRLIEQMEREGVVSPLTSAGKREVLAPNAQAAAK